MFTKQHYEQIAQIVKDLKDKYNGFPPIVQDELATKLADMFENDNPRFSRMRFYLACGLELSK